MRTRLFVTASFLTTLYKQGGKNFGQIAQAELVNYGDQWKDVELVDGKDSIYNPDKAKAAFEKARKTWNLKGNIPNSLGCPS